jgi:site-specific DNA-methyltransferase (adenine-specific)
MKAKSEVFNEDCMVGMARYPDKYFELAIVDPPYGINRDLWDSRPKQKYWKELFRVSANQIVFGGNYFRLPITENWLCWDKTNNGKSFFKHKAKFELLWLSIKTKPEFLRYTLDGNVEGWTKAKPNYDKVKAIHSCQKPTPLYEWLLMNYAKEGDKILDTHLGSGSSRIAAYKLGFDFVGFELDKEYFDASEKRFKEVTSQLTIF